MNGGCHCPWLPGKAKAVLTPTATVAHAIRLLSVKKRSQRCSEGSSSSPLPSPPSNSPMLCCAVLSHSVVSDSATPWTPLISLIFLTRSLVFPILLFSSISLHWSLRKALLSLLAILWISEFTWVYISFSPLPFASLLFSSICKPPQSTVLPFLHFFFIGIVLITTSYTMLQPTIHNSSGMFVYQI